jgi:hypothetical protein
VVVGARESERGLYVKRETSKGANQPIRSEKLSADPLIGRRDPGNALDAFHYNSQS